MNATVLPPHLHPWRGRRSRHHCNYDHARAFPRVLAREGLTVYQTREAVLLEQILGPDDAVDGLGRRVSYGASWKGLLSRLRLALVAFGQTLRPEGAEHSHTAASLHLVTDWKRPDIPPNCLTM